MLNSCISFQFTLLYIFSSNGFLVAKMRYNFNTHSKIKYSRDHKSYKASRRAVVPFYKTYKMNHIISLYCNAKKGHSSPTDSEERIMSPYVISMIDQVIVSTATQIVDIILPLTMNNTFLS